MTDDELLDSLLDHWEEADRRQQPLSATELCGSRTDLIDILARKIQALIDLKPMERTDQRGGRPPVGGQDAGCTLRDGRYELIERLGRGAEGDVWRARDKVLDRDVAVKLPLVQADDVLAEARLIARLGHPHIIKVFDCGDDNRGTAFVVTELMQGRSLHERLRAGSGRIRPAVAVRWTGQLAAAVAALHQFGRIHRDIKPGNILIDSHDNPVLADFGIALEITDPSTGSSRGSPGYKSPEQRRAAPLDARSDIFSLAVVLHEMLTGRLPFADLGQLAAANDRRGQPPAVKLAADVPPQLRSILASSLATDPADRPQSATEFAAALERAWRRSRLGFWLGRAAVAAAVGLGLLGWRLRQQHLRSTAAIAAQTQEARQTILDVTDVFDEQRRKIDDIRALSRRITEEAMNDPFHKARRAERDARRRAEESSTADE